MRTLAEVEVVLQGLDRAAAASLSTAHPQGGNPLHPDSGCGAVDPSFRLHGANSVYVCDASVFPTSLGINPQLTVMSLADTCGSSLAGRGA